MSIGFFFVGAGIFAIYVWFTLWIIFDQSKKQREEGNGTKYDIADMDGMGNYGRIPNKKPKYVSKRSNVSGRRSVRKAKS